MERPIRHGLVVAAAAAALVQVPPAAAADADVGVQVRPDGFLWAGQRLDDVEQLAAVLLPRTPRSVALRACGPEAVPAWKAAAHRFRLLELHLAVDVAACPAPVLASLSSAGVVAPATAGVAVEAWWAGMMP